jgi:DNA processing protein
MNGKLGALVWMNRICGFATQKMQRLLAIAGDADIRRQFPSLYARVAQMMGSDTAGLMMQTCTDEELLNREFDLLARAGIRTISYADEEYPALLKEIPLPPLLLYCKGDISLMQTRCIGIVGSRDPSRYGLEVTELFSKTLAKCGLTIVSGLARGIDSTAHRAALEAGGKTIAVLGCGIDKIYPADNAPLYKKIEKDGLLISEYGPGVPASNFQFPERNRIISGLSEGVLVTEAGQKSGSLHTANNAVDQGRDLYVVPCNITSSRGFGSNMLIKKMPHCAVFSPDDVAERLGIHGYKEPVSAMQLDFIEEKLVAGLGYAELNFEQLLELTGLGASELNATLTKLELFGIIKKLDNNYYGV